MRNSYKKELHMYRILIAAVVAIVAVTPVFGKDLRADKNKAIVRRIFTDILSQGRFEVAPEIYAKDFVNHETTRDLGIDHRKRNRRRRLCDGGVERARHEHGQREWLERDREDGGRPRNQHLSR